ADGLGGELELDVVELEELLVLLDERVARDRQDLHQGVDVEIVDGGDHREPADELGDQAELREVLGAYLGEQVVGVALLRALDLRGEAEGLLADALLDDVVEPGERNADDEQEGRGVAIAELLVEERAG